MRSATYVAFGALFTTVIALTFTLSGCAPKKTGRIRSGEEGPEEAKAKTAIKPGTASITGKVVFGGSRPDYVKTPEIQNKPECNKCTIPPGKEYWDADQKWIVGPEPEKGVANVVVRLKTPDNSFFETSDADKQKAAKEEVVLDQQCCNFDPHVIVVFPYYTTDGKNILPTGQALLVKNSGSMAHNTNFQGDSRKDNNENFAVPAGSQKKVFLKPENDTLIPIGCVVHTWMNAKVFAYDHPYAMRTTESGDFLLKNINVGTTLTVEFWHEGKVVDTRTVTLAENKTEDLGKITIGK